MPEPRDAAFTSSRADAEFNARFHEPVKQMLTELITDSGPVYERIGKCWSEVEGVLEALNESEAHKPSEGATLAGDLQDAVISALAFLFEGKPLVARMAPPSRCGISSAALRRRTRRRARSARLRRQRTGRLRLRTSRHLVSRPCRRRSARRRGLAALRWSPTT